MKLSLGVMDVPYVDNPPAKGKRKRGRKANHTTTGDVAEILEAKYGIMQFFADHHGDDIVAAMEKAMQGHIEDMLMGAPLSANILAEAESEIEATFKHFLSNREMDGKVDGVATEAALKGINHRLKSRRGSARPSFIDTGAYQASFKAEFNE